MRSESKFIHSGLISSYTGRGSFSFFEIANIANDRILVLQISLGAVGLVSSLLRSFFQKNCRSDILFSVCRICFKTFGAFFPILGPSDYGSSHPPPSTTPRPLRPGDSGFTLPLLNPGDPGSLSHEPSRPRKRVRRAHLDGGGPISHEPISHESVI